MVKKFIFFNIILVLALSGCQLKNYTSEQPSAQRLQFGEGGGFTGAVTTYILRDNGQLFRHNSLENAETEIGTLDRRQAKALFKEAVSLKLDTENVNEPGDIYYFIRLEKKHPTSGYTWGNPAFAANPQIQAFYKKLIQSVKQAQPPLK